MAYLRLFINYKQNNWVRFFLMTKFTYNIAKNASTDHIFSELNYGYYPYISYKKEIDFCFKSKLAKKLLIKLYELIII